MAHLRALNILRKLSLPTHLSVSKGFHRLDLRMSVLSHDFTFIPCEDHIQTRYYCHHKFIWNIPPFHSNSVTQIRLYGVQTQDSKDSKSKQEKQEAPSDSSEIDDYEKLSRFQKFKAMFRDYWYVLMPVHLSSSIVFLGIFYYAASSGVDIVAVMEKLNLSESIISPFRDSSAGYIAITYALYKIFTPVRYTVTLGGTTWAIKFLTDRGLIKPRPMKEAKQNVQNIITAMKMPENQRQKFLEEKGMPRLGKAVGQASNKNHHKKE